MMVPSDKESINHAVHMWSYSIQASTEYSRCRGNERQGTCELMEILKGHYDPKPWPLSSITSSTFVIMPMKSQYENMLLLYELGQSTANLETY